MASFESRLIAIFMAVLVTGASPPSAEAQQQQQGFEVERFYPAAPGSGWFVMDDLNMSGGLGGAVTLTTGYSRNSLEHVVSDAAFVNLGIAGTYDRYLAYLNFPMPLAVSGTKGTLGGYPFSAPLVSPGTSPDIITDPRVGFEMRIAGAPGNRLRIGAGAQLIFPSGERADYTSDSRYRGMFRFLAAGDRGSVSYAGQVGLHVRTLDDSPVPESPNGNEFLFGASIGRRFSLQKGWKGMVGTEIYGETAFHSFLDKQRTGVEGLVTARLEKAGSPLRFKLGTGHGVVQHFGAPEWRILFGMEFLGQMLRQ